MKHTSFFLSLGSNLGDREAYLREAIAKLEQHKHISITQCSSIYETAPVGYVEQGKFLNMVVEGQTSLPAEELVQVTQGIEQALGRTRELVWGPRTIDIDILLYGQLQIESQHLVIPHPRMNERAFVMIPLAELQPDLTFPDGTKNFKEFVYSSQEEGVHIWKGKRKNGEGVFGLFES